MNNYCIFVRFITSNLMFQLQALEGEISEFDASGHCNVSYYTSTTNTKKVKSNCDYDDLENLRHEDKILGTNILSTRATDYKKDDSGKLLKTIVSRESHRISVNAKQELGSIINSEQFLSYEQAHNCDIIKAESLEKAIEQLIHHRNLNMVEETLVTGLEGLSKSNGKQQFSKEVNLLRDSLKTEYLGTLKSAKAFLTLLAEARTSSTEDISKSLSSKKNLKIL